MYKFSYIQKYSESSIKVTKLTPVNRNETEKMMKKIKCTLANFFYYVAHIIKGKYVLLIKLNNIVNKALTILFLCSHTPTLLNCRWNYQK